jgi:diguanylate cyclase (GGDEF)-like protein
MPIIVSIGEGYETREYSFSQSQIVIGRLARSDIVLKNSQISRRHAQITQQDGVFTIEDLGSTNAVYVNHAPVRRSELKHGDLFNVGGVQDFIFLERADANLTAELLQRIKHQPEYFPAAYAMKQAVKDLVTEANREEPGAAPVNATPVPVALDDVEGLLHIAYTLNSTLSLRDVLETILTKVLATASADRAFILLKNARTRELEVKFARDGSGPLTGSAAEDFPQQVARRCVAEDQPLDSMLLEADEALAALVPAAERKRPFMTAPLKVKTSTIGAIHVDRLAGSPAFGRKASLFFRALCHQAAVAIDNARLTEDLKDKQKKLAAAYDELLDKNTRLQVTNEQLDQKVAELAALNAVSRGLNMVSTLDQVLKLILEKTIELLSVEKGSLMLINEETDTLELKVVIGAEMDARPERAEGRLKVGEGIAGMALRQGTPIAINDGAKNPKFKMMLPEDASVRSLLCVPLILNNRKIGVINLTNKLTGLGFTDNDKTLVATMAAQAAITIENARLYNLAIFDGLTNLHVARYFHLYLEKEIQRCRRYGGQVSLVMCDLDHFKSINDTHGHQVGDLVLQRLAQIIRETARTIDVPARYGGEEFAVILPETDLEGAAIFAERLRKAVETTPIRFRDRELAVTLSVGVANFPSSGAENKTQLVGLADKLLYDAKRGGRNQVHVSPVSPNAPTVMPRPTAADASDEA